MSEKLILAIPSKGRLMERTTEVFAEAGMTVEKSGHERGYTGHIVELPGVEVAFLSASEIAFAIKRGRVHLGVTGEDLLREHIASTNMQTDFIKPLGFGLANVVVAVPACWIDVFYIADLEQIASTFTREHGRRLRVATKYLNLTRRYFAENGITSYRIVESLGATEGTPVAGTAELIVDITSSGATIAANHLRVLEDGIVLKSQANLVASRSIQWSSGLNEIRNEIIERIGA